MNFHLRTNQEKVNVKFLEKLKQKNLLVTVSDQFCSLMEKKNFLE